MASHVPDREPSLARSGWIATGAYELSMQVGETERCEPGRVRGPGITVPHVMQFLAEIARIFVITDGEKLKC